MQNKLVINTIFVISRAVTRLHPFIGWIKMNISNKEFNELPNGILYLKGGELTEELSEINKKYQLHSIPSYFEEEFFETKKIVHVEL